MLKGVHARQRAPRFRARRRWRLPSLRSRPRGLPFHFIAAGAIAFAALIAATVTFWPRTPPAPDARAQCLAAANLPAFATPAVVVLPFTAEGAQAQAFADAITDRIGDSLSAAPRLSIVTGPPRGHADLSKPRRELAEGLGVTHVLDGTVRVDDGEASVNVRLIDRERGEVLWSTLQSYPVADRLQARDAVALEVLRAVQLELTDGEQATHFPQTTSFEVLEHVFTGSDYLDRLSQDNSRRARAEFEAALAIDPRDPPANTGMAWTYAADVLFGWSASPAEDLVSAERYTQAATRADPDYFYAHSVRGLIALLRGDHRTAVAQGEEALRLSGSGADAVAVHALTLSYAGDARRSLELAQRAIQLRPYTHPEWYQWILARAARLNGMPQTAIACLPASGLQDAYAGAAMVERALALADAGESTQARTLMETAQRQSSFTPQTYCAHPPYASTALTQQCVASLTRAGATQ